jgi:hypothetical protein
MWCQGYPRNFLKVKYLRDQEEDCDDLYIVSNVLKCRFRGWRNISGTGRKVYIHNIIFRHFLCPFETSKKRYFIFQML